MKGVFATATRIRQRQSFKRNWPDDTEQATDMTLTGAWQAALKQLLNRPEY